jgi:cytochrome c oxidase subunit 1
MPRRVYTYSPGMGFDTMNLVSTIGALLLIPSVLIFLWNLIASKKNGAPAGNDPWGAPTLEWAIPSPPPVYNFGTLPQVSSLDPLWHESSRKAALASNHVAGPIHMPPNSYWPLVSALGITMLLGGIVFGWYLGIPGLIITLVGLYRWSFEPCH